MFFSNYFKLFYGGLVSDYAKLGKYLFSYLLYDDDYLVSLMILDRVLLPYKLSKPCKLLF